MSAVATGRDGLMVAVPVLFIDETMPELKDTELRVLLAVLRQTRVAGRETPSAWLTHTALCKRTGRASEAVSAAIEKLVRKGILQVTDETGLRLNTPAERRRAEGRRFYRAGNLTVEMEDEAAKSKTIEVKKKYYSLRKTDPITPERPYTEGKTGNDISSPPIKPQIEAEKAKIRERLKHLPRLGA